MSERDNYPAGVPCWVETLQQDPQGASRFYGTLFGWDFAGPGPMPGDPPGEYFVARVDGRDVAGIGTQPGNGQAPAPMWTTYIRVDSADAAAGAVKSAGGHVAVEPFDVLPAGRMAVLTDPAGAQFCVWEAGDREGAQLVNQPRAWAMSMLHTSDVEAAEAFYGAVFGWEGERVAMGPLQLTLFRLPGYVGGEEHQPVPRDVVGVMVTISSGDVKPHWSVDFWVNDADAAAAQAAQLGGRVVTPPHDIPGFRNAVLADPQGAVLSVSQLTPEA